ncbi:MAG: histidine triad (HIT) protein [Chloroflexi bacterium]|nr:histidine triad (HIT) protein [Chloroflexota bacterium]
MGSNCQICAKHRGEGPLGGELVARLDGFRVYHAPPGEDGLAALGHLFIESERHAPYLDDLTHEESAALGRLRTRLVRALRAELDAEHVFTAVIGRGIAHFHEHVFVRHAGTLAVVPWHQSDEAAPRADRAAVADLARGLGRHLTPG